MELENLFCAFFDLLFCSGPGYYPKILGLDRHKTVFWQSRLKFQSNLGVQKYIFFTFYYFYLIIFFLFIFLGIHYNDYIWIMDPLGLVINNFFSLA